MALRQAKKVKAKGYIRFVENRMRLERGMQGDLTPEQRTLVKVAVQFVQSRDRDLLEQLPDRDNVSREQHWVLAYTAIRLMKKRLARDLEQQNLQWVVLYWGEPQMQKYLDLAETCRIERIELSE